MEHRESCAHCGMVPVAETARQAHRVVCESPAMRELLGRAARFAGSDAPVLVLGESGTGKEIVARVLHANGPRADMPFVPVNVAALPAELLESELFGHAKGAFTGALQARRGLFEEASGGTLFLDEIGEMPLSLQAKLLRALSDGEIRRVGADRPFAVDVRIACATHRDLAEEVRRGAFREDLYYRLAVLTLRVPPLRERPEDVMPLARQFLAAERTAARAFSADAERALRAHRWPGNVRELQSAVKHGAALARGAKVERDDLPDTLLGTAGSPHADRAPALRPLAEVEREHVRAVLDACGGNRTDAARILGIGRNTLWRKLERWS